MKKDKEYPIKYDDSYAVVTANDLIKGRQKMSLRESQLFAIAISQIVKDDKDLKTYTTTIPELAEFMGVEQSNLYRDIKGLCRSLCSRVVEISTLTPKKKPQWEIFHLVSSAKYDGETLTLRLSDDIKPFVIELEKNYSQPMLGVLMSFRSYYASRLYQYCLAESGKSKSGKEEWSFTCDELRELFQTYEKDNDGNITKVLYQQNRDLLLRTIIPALAELHSSDFAFVFDYSELRQHKPGQRGQASVFGVSFKLMFFKDKAEKERMVNALIKGVEVKGGKVIPFGEEPKKKKKKKATQKKNAKPKFEQTTFEGCEDMPEPPVDK